MSPCSNNLHLRLIIILILSTVFAVAYPFTPLLPTPVRRLSTSEGLSSDQVEQLMQDSKGYIWAATRNGLVRFDGVRSVTYKSGIRSGEILTSNDVRAIAEDRAGKIWIGTTDGLTVFDMPTESFRRHTFQCFRNNPVSCILSTRDNRIFIGTDQGLFEYIAAGDTVKLYTRSSSGDVMPQTSVKALMEDSRGNIWIGTWNEGIYRIDTSGRFYSYPTINERKSAHVIFEDSSHRIWVGTWGCGLEMLRNPYDPEKAAWVKYTYNPSDPRSICDNIIYSIAEDPATRTVWVGTQRGISLLREEGNGFITLSMPDGAPQLREPTSIIRDNTGMMWVGLLGNGAIAFTSRPSLISHEDISGIEQRFGSSYIHRIMIDSHGRRWLSLGNNAGLVVHDPATSAIISNPALPYSAASPAPYTVMSMLETKEGNVWLGTYDGGLYLVDSSLRRMEHYLKKENPWLAGDRVSEILIDSRGRLWTGGLPGLTVVMPDFSYLRFDDLVDGEIRVSAIEEGRDGAIWVATSNIGILRIEGVGVNAATYSVRRYTPKNGNINSWVFSAIYCDDLGRIWAGSDDTGLSLYDFESDSFRGVHMKWNLPGDAVAGIVGDKTGNLWVATDMGLLNLNTASIEEPVRFRVFSSADGIRDNYFHRKSACRDRDGRIYFGGSNGLSIISGDMTSPSGPDLPVLIRDIRIDGISWGDLDHERRQVFSPTSPAYTECIDLSGGNDNIMIEFGVADYSGSPICRQYSYRLEGYEDDWHTTDDGHRSAYYSNLPAGSYTFRVRSTDEAGNWSENVRSLEVRVNPSPWTSWWAWIIYALCFAAIAFVLVRYWQRHVRNSAERRMRELLQAQAAELHHTREKLERLSRSLDMAASPATGDDPDGAPPSGQEDDVATLIAQWITPECSAADESFLRHAVEFILENISDPELSQETFMEEMNITKSTLFRKLKALTGMSYTSFVRHIRLKSALGMLHSGKGLRISEIAYAVGFNDPKYFSQCFKKEFGILPSEYIDDFISGAE